MSEYSAEWCEVNQIGILPDFSVNEIFNSLEIGQSVEVICEGYGFTHIINKGGCCFVKINNKEVAFDTLEKKG